MATLKVDTITSADTPTVSITDGASISGVTTFSSDINIADKIVHAGDTNTAIRFADADTVTVETGGSERVSIASDGKVAISDTSPEELLDLGESNQQNLKLGQRGYIGQGYSTGATILGHSVKAKTTGTTSGGMEVTESNSGGGAPSAIRLQSGNIEFHTAASGTSGAAFDSERLRINSAGTVIAGATSVSAGNRSQYSILAAVSNNTSATGHGVFTIQAGANSSSGNEVAQLCFSDPQGDYAWIQAFADATTGSTDKPGRLVFSTSADGSAVPTERLRIDSSGNLIVNKGNAGNNALILLSKADAGYAKLEFDVGTSQKAYVELDASEDLVHYGASGVAQKFYAGGNEWLSITSAGVVNIGGAAVSQSRNLNIGSNSEANLAIETHNDATSESANIRFYKSGATGASPEIVETDDVIARLQAYGYDGNDYANQACGIDFMVDGAPASNDMPGKIVFKTNPNTTSPTTRLTIGKDGEIKFANSTITERMHYDSGGGMQSNYNHDVITYGMVWYGATNAAGTWTFNLRGDGSTTFNSLIDNNTTTTLTMIAGNNNASYYMTAFKIDGTTQTVEWAGGSAPSAGTGSGYDSYVVTIFKSSSNSYKCFGNFTNFN